MGYPTKITTCCYCGARAALVLNGKVRHELACSSCGAPLHEMKKIPVAREGDVELVDRPKSAPRAKWKADSAYKPKKVKKKKKRKSLLKSVFEEAFDFVEDIFD